MSGDLERTIEIEKRIMDRTIKGAEFDPIIEDLREEIKDLRVETKLLRSLCRLLQKEMDALVKVKA